MQEVNNASYVIIKDGNELTFVGFDFNDGTQLHFDDEQGVSWEVRTCSVVCRQCKSIENKALAF